MKTLLLAASLVVLAASVVLGDSRSQADEAFAQGRYEQAERLYVEALALGGDDLDIEFRLGCCAHRLGRHAAAAHRFRRVLEVRPRDVRARFNLRLAASRLENPVALEESGGVAAALERTTPFERIAGASCVLALLLLGCVILRPRWVRALLAAMILACLVVQGAAVNEMLRAERDGLVLDQGAIVRSVPNGAAPESFRLLPADGIVVLEASDRWVRIACARGEGWARREDVGIIG